MFSCEICEGFKSNYFEEHLQTTAHNHIKSAIFFSYQKVKIRFYIRAWHIFVALRFYFRILNSFVHFTLFNNWYQKLIQNSVKHLRWNVLRKSLTASQPLTIFAKRFTLDVWQASEYASGYWRITSDNARDFDFKINLDKGRLFLKYNSKNFTLLNHFGTDDQYIKTVEKITIKRMIFPLQREIRLIVEKEGCWRLFLNIRHLYLLM